MTCFLSFFLSYRVTEEYDLVDNPVYNISMQRNNPQQGMITTRGTVATTTGGNTPAVVTYEEVT